jgi:glycyl-tRNA synthetase beta chain
MPELLLELFSEEIPARMQLSGARDLERLFVERLTDAGYEIADARSFATPRRLCLVVDGLASRQPDQRDERKGPKTNAPEKALNGFLRSVGLSLEDLETRTDKKGDYYVAVIEKEGRPTPELVQKITTDIVRSFPWPKSMKWGSGTLRWVRPLHSVLCVFDRMSIQFDLDGTPVGDTTRGHRFHAPQELRVQTFDEYVSKLEEAYVVLDGKMRRRKIETEARALVEPLGFELVLDQDLLDEVAGLVEWPIILLGDIDAALVQPIEKGGLPPEVLMTAMKTHQKYFSVRDPKTGLLARHFVMAANLDAVDGGEAIARGNERVLRARLADAKFFWDLDRKEKLEARVEALSEVVFHAEIGTLREKVERVQGLAMKLASQIDADPALAGRAALLAKADLTTEMVGEFPELQGLMGRYYADLDGEPAEIGAAIEHHYSPQGPADQCPSDPVSVAVALADKIDMLVQFFHIGRPPTGSKDPFALRRAALGVIRLILENDLRLNLTDLFKSLQQEWPGLLEFFGDRLKVQQRERGARHDLIDAVFSLDGQDDLVLIVRRVDALASFLDSDDGANLLAGYKRASNIIRIEEKKDKSSFHGAAEPQLMQLDQEKNLNNVIVASRASIREALGREDFESAMLAAAALRGPVDAFFEHVTVNADDQDVRANRLRLLSEIRDALNEIADFSRIEG